MVSQLISNMWARGFEVDILFYQRVEILVRVSYSILMFILGSFKINISFAISLNLLHYLGREMKTLHD